MQRIHKMTTQKKTLNTQYDLSTFILRAGAKRLQLNKNEFWVLLGLSDNANSEFVCFPSISTIGDKVGVSESTVKRSLTNLCKMGLIHKRSRGFNKSNSYLFSISGITDRFYNGIGQTEPLENTDEKDITVGHTEPLGGQGEPLVGHTDTTDRSHRPTNNTTNNTINNTNNNTTILKDTEKEDNTNPIKEGEEVKVEVNDTPKCTTVSNTPYPEVIEDTTPSEGNQIVFTTPSTIPAYNTVQSEPDTDNPIPQKCGEVIAPDLDFNPYSFEEPTKKKKSNTNQGWDIDDLPF